MSLRTKQGKRIVSLLLAACMTVSSVYISPLTASAGNETSGVMYGDADGNNEINLKDVNLMERYISGEETAADAIDKVKADVNVDGIVDAEDVSLVKEYLVGNGELNPTLCTVTFDTCGGNAAAPITVGAGMTWKGDVPNAVKDGSVFVRWVKPDGTQYYQNSDVISGDITLKAEYTETASEETLNINSFSLSNQPTNASFRIAGAPGAAENVKNNIALLPKDGSEPVGIDVKEEGSGVYTVSAPNGFNPGATYELTLGDGLSFMNEDGTEKDEMFRTVNFDIEKAKGDNLKYNPNVIFVQDTEAMTYTIGNETKDVLETALFSNSESGNETVSGTINNPASNLQIDDVVCIYQKVDPRNRDYTKLENNDYEDDALAYVRIVAVNGDGSLGFESLSEDDADEVLAMPDSIPYKVSVLPTGTSGTTGTVDINAYDAGARAYLGKTEAPEFNVNDFLVFYTVDFKEALNSNIDAEAVYGQITGVSGNTVSYKIISKEDIESYTGLFTSKDNYGAEIYEEIKGTQQEQQLLANIEAQAENSGFIGAATEKMLRSAFSSENIRKQLLDNGYTDEEIDGIVSEAGNIARAGAGGGSGSKRAKLVVEEKSVVPGFVKGEHFKNGIGVELEIRVLLSLEKKSPVQTSEVVKQMTTLKIDLSAGFVEEVELGVDVDVEDRWKWYAFIPVLKDLDVTVDVDIKNYSSVSLGVKIYTIKDTELKNKWKALDSTLGASSGTLRKIDSLAKQVLKLRKKGEAVQEIIEQINALKDSIPKIKVENDDGTSTEYTYEELENELGVEKAYETFDSMYGAKTKEAAKQDLSQLMDKYKTMLDSECDWVEIVNENIAKKTIKIKVVVIELSLNFVISANVNISAGADIEYEVGKRYSFWIHIMDRKSGSSECDLIDEHFRFQFYVMGTLGLRAGVRLQIAIGIISTKIGSVGASIEFGPYIKMWGYFIYIYEKYRPANTDKWFDSEEMQGAMYIDFGLYLTVKFKAQALDELIKYEPTLYDKEWPLLTAGAKQAVYDFALKPGNTDILYINDEDSNSTTGITMNLPELYRTMDTMDLTSGEKSQAAYPMDKFIVTFSDARFSIDRNGRISVDVPEDARYLRCDMRLVWLCDKLAFSKFDTDLTVPVVWTNMSEEERTEKFTVSVRVGNSVDGYKTVWSDRVTRLDVFDLPSQDEILKLINYDGFTMEKTDGGVEYSENVKYADKGAYTEQSTGLSVVQDTLYTYEIAPKAYTLTVNGIQNTDGTTESRIYKAFYGDTFDLSELESTGTYDAENMAFTSFDALALGDSKVKGALTVNLEYIDSFGENAVAEAKYNNDIRTATFVFVGLGSDVEPVRIKFRKGTTPYYPDIYAHVESLGGTVDSIEPVIAPSESSVRYQVNCSPVKTTTDEDGNIVVVTPKEYTVTFNTNGGNSINAQKYSEGCLIWAPTAPVRTGYSFEGWCTDEGCNNTFEFSNEDNKKIKDDFTLYAKWKANSYTLRFDKNGFGVAPVDGSITYDSSYGALPVLSDTNKKFLGWFTEAVGGTQVTADTVFTNTENTTIYAHWTNKASYSLSCSKQTNLVYNRNQQSVTYSTSCPTTGLGIEYRKWLGSGKYTTWSATDIPVNAGTYDVRFTRATDNDYYAYSSTVTEAVIIGKATPTFSSPKFDTTGGTVRAYFTKNDTEADGQLTYELYWESILFGDLLEASNNTGFFTDLSAGLYKVKIKAAEGENFLGGTSEFSSKITVSGNEKGPFSVWVETNTIDGTDNPVYARLTSNGKWIGDAETHLGTNDPAFEKGWGINNIITATKDTAGRWNGVVPWEINGGYLHVGDDQGFTPGWEIRESYLKLGNEYTKVYYGEFPAYITGFLYGSGIKTERYNYITPVHLPRTYTLVDNKWKMINCRRGDTGDDNQQLMLDDSKGQDSLYLRQITGLEDFYDGIYTVSKYWFEWDGDITDQFEMFGRDDSGNVIPYNAMEYYGAPTLTVTSGNPEYDRYIRWDNVTNFKIDFDYLKDDHGSNCYAKYTITLTFPELTVDGNNTFSYTIDSKGVKGPLKSYRSSSTAQAAATAATYSQNTPLAGTGAATVNMALDVEASDSKTVIPSLTLTPENVALNRGKTFDVAVKADDDVRIWGILADVGYDTDMLELQGYTVGNVFDEDRFVFGNDMTKSSYKFLAALGTADTVSAKGNIVSLRFKVKQTAEEKATVIKLNSLEAIDEKGNIVLQSGNTTSVTADDTAPAIDGIIDGGIYYDETTFTIEEDNLAEVKVNNSIVTVEDGKITLYPADGAQTIIITDKAGNSKTYTVTISHNFSADLKSDGTNHWYECACGEKKDIEAHKYSEDLKSDGTSHWYECVCGAKKDMEAHEYSEDWKSDGTNHWYECVCGAKKDIEAHECSEDWKSDETSHWHECACGERAEEDVHSLEWVTVKEATTAEKGLEQEVCTACGFVNASRDIPMIVEKPNKPATDEPGKLPDKPTGTGDSAVPMASAVALAFLSATTAVIVTKRRRKNCR